MLFPGNAKQGDVQAIRESVEAHGQYRSLIVRSHDGHLTVLAGNHTLLAIRDLGHDAARCEIITCDDETATKINLADNKLASLGAYDSEALSALLTTLETYEGTGYTDAEIGDLLDDLEAVSAPVVMEPQPTDARYAETPEEYEERKERIENYEPRHGGGDITELILVLTVAQRDEAVILIKSLQTAAGSEPTAGETVLAALRDADNEPQDGS